MNLKKDIEGLPNPFDISYLGNIVIHPEYQNKNIGSYIIALIDAKSHNCKKWRLSTPEWKIRNHYFM